MAVDKRVRLGAVFALGLGVVALVTYFTVSRNQVECSVGTPSFVYTVYGTQYRSSDATFFSEGKQTYLTEDGTSGDPAFSPDGGRVVFSSGRLGSWDPNYGAGENGVEHKALFIARADEAGRFNSKTSVLQLTDGPYDSEPDWSPDGSKVVFVREPRNGYGDAELWVVDLDSKEDELLLRIPSEPDLDNQILSPAWSPDGNQIAFVQARGGGAEWMDIWLVEGDGSDARQLPARVRALGGAGSWSGGVSWSPAGDRLVFDSAIDFDQEALYILDLDGGRPRLLTDGAWPAWSPDGSRIAYFKRAGGEFWRLSTIASDGTGGRSVPGAKRVGFYGNEGLDWACS